MIVATDENGAIGLDGGLPWSCKEDLAYFKQQTLGCKVIMGNTTYKSLPFNGGFPERNNLVLSNRYKGKQPNINVCYIDKSLLLGGIENSDQTYWVIGGKSVYEQLLPLVDEVHHTTIKGEYLADTYLEDTWTHSDEWSLDKSLYLSEVATVNIWKRK